MHCAERCTLPQNGSSARQPGNDPVVSLYRYLVMRRVHNCSSRHGCWPRGYRIIKVRMSSRFSVFFPSIERSKMGDIVESGIACKHNVNLATPTKGQIRHCFPCLNEGGLMRPPFFEHIQLNTRSQYRS